MKKIAKNKLTSGTDFFFIDGANFHGLRYTLKGDGVITGKVASVTLLRVTFTIEGSGIVTESLTVFEGP